LDDRADLGKHCGIVGARKRFENVTLCCELGHA
jgi:hypothetical protein